MPTQPCIGFPTDTLGSDGDAAQDLQNRIIYFPKANGTWANAKPYAFQGQVGPALLSFPSTPPDTAGSPGQGAIDASTGLTFVKSSQNTWGSAVGQILGAQGIAGPAGNAQPSVAGQCYSFAPYAANTNAISLSGTPQDLPAAGTTQPSYFVPFQPTTFVGATFVLSSAGSPSSCTFSLVDITAAKTVYSYTISQAGTVVNQTASVPLTTGNTHAWKVSGSGSSYAIAQGFLLQPSSPGVTTTYGPLFQTTFTSAPTTAKALGVGGSLTITQYMGLIKPCFLYSAQYVNTSASTATFNLYSTTSATIIYTVNVPANTTLPLTLGPYTVNQFAFSATYFRWGVVSNSPGYFSVMPQLCL